MATTVRLKTYDDLCRMPDDGNRYELIGGEIVVTSIPSWMHQLAAADFLKRIDDVVTADNLGWVSHGPLDIRLSEHDVVQPDVVYVSRARSSVLTSNGTSGAPDLVVEVTSPMSRSRDLGEKLELYARSGVREYWLADPDVRQFRSFTLTADGYQPIPLDGSTFRPLLLPGLEFDVDALFARLDAP